MIRQIQANNNVINVNRRHFATMEEHLTLTPRGNNGGLSKSPA